MAVAGQLWPHIGAALASLVQDKLPALLDQNRPRWMTAIELHTFTLGNEPPQVNGVKVLPVSCSFETSCLPSVNSGADQSLMIVCYMMELRRV